ncbi:MAG: type II toxin-antitoxin system RelE/ParE family toxin, partial [Elusimicrobia bacterium]|nr:type II toxin-antitoxin system RelE/ParE family toxin [Elusimicrobiota bacterium]
RWTLQAAEDLDFIVSFIAKDSTPYARLFVVDVFEAVDRLIQFPESGRTVPELNDPAVRELILGNYRLVYRLKKDIVELLTVYHGARLLDPSKLK